MRKNEISARKRIKSNCCNRNTVTRILVHLVNLQRSGTSKCLPAEAHGKAECSWAIGLITNIPRTDTDQIRGRAERLI